MNNVESSASQIKELVQEASKALVVLRAQPSRDGVAAVLALADSLRALGKEAALASPQPIQSDLAGVDSFVTELGPKSLVISLDYQPGSIKKIHYGPEGNKFNLTITPGRGQRISTENIEVTEQGRDYDLVFVLDTTEPAILGDIYESERETWQNVPVINIDRNPANTQFGQVNILDPESNSLSEIIFRLVRGAGLPLTPSGAGLLLAGLRASSNEFTNARPETFEAAAEITRIARGEERKETSEEKLVNEPFRTQDDYLKLGAKLLS